MALFITENPSIFKSDMEKKHIFHREMLKSKGIISERSILGSNYRNV